MASEIVSRESDIGHESIVRDISAVACLTTLCGALFFGAGTYHTATSDSYIAPQNHEEVTQNTSSEWSKTKAVGFLGACTLVSAGAAFGSGRSAVQAQQRVNYLKNLP